MPYWNCYFHLVWGTKYRKPLITPQLESLIFSTIKQKSGELHSPILAINAVADHIHIAVCISPSVATSKWVGHVKGLTSHAINAAFPNLETTFKWQEGYGVVTFGEKNLPFVEEYIASQKTRHSNGQIIPKLERIDDD